MQGRLRPQPNGDSVSPLHSLRRVGVIATRRLGNAVARNRAKRLLREAFRKQQTSLPPGSDLVLVARRRIHGKSSGEVEQLLQDNALRFARWADRQLEKPS